MEPHPYTCDVCHEAFLIVFPERPEPPLAIYCPIGGHEAYYDDGE